MSKINPELLQSLEYAAQRARHDAHMAREGCYDPSTGELEAAQSEGVDLLRYLEDRVVAWEAKVELVNQLLEELRA